MKFACLSVLLFLFCLNTAAQQPVAAAPPSVEVVKKQWYKEFNSPAFEKSPFAGAEEMQQLNRDRRAVRRENVRRVQRGLPALRTPVSAAAPPAEQGNTDSPDIYTYKLKIKNNGNKQIKALIWDRVFYETGTTNEVGRIQFEYAADIKPGKTRDIAVSTEIAPSKTVSVKAAGKKLREQYTDEIIFQTIEYADGSVWNNAAATEAPN